MRDTLLLMCGVGIIVTVVIVILYAALRGRMNSTVIGAVGIIGMMLAIVATNLPDIAGLAIQWGKDQLYSLQLQRTAEQVNTKAAEVRTDTGEVRKMKKDIEDLLKRVEQGEKTTSQMNRELTEVQEQAAERALSEEQKRTLIAALSRFQGQKVKVAYTWGDKEGGRFAQSLAAALKDAGWQGEREGNPPDVIMAGRDPSIAGVSVNINEQDAAGGRVPEPAQALVSLLVDFGVVKKRMVYPDAGLPAGVIEVGVGTKPAPGQDTP